MIPLTIFAVEDMLGSSRVMTTASGAVCYDADFYPFGGERTYTNTCPQNHKFEGKERDAETGNNDVGARYYVSRLGRWLLADWSAVPMPYANHDNPQKLKHGAMASENLDTFADVDGIIDEVLGLPENLAPLLWRPHKTSNFRASPVLFDPLIRGLPP